MQSNTFLSGNNQYPELSLFLRSTPASLSISLLLSESSQCLFFLPTSAPSLSNTSIKLQLWDEERKRDMPFIRSLGAWSEHAVRDKRSSTLVFHLSGGASRFLSRKCGHAGRGKWCKEYISGNKKSPTSCSSFQRHQVTKVNTAFRILIEILSLRGEKGVRKLA